MQVVRTIAEARTAIEPRRRAGERIGFVPTMGALHAGHTSLVDAARRDACFTVVSIFVNPTQFGPNEDLARYPRDEPGDLAACRRSGVDLAFLPSAAEMYRDGASTTIRVAGLTETLCGPHRPGHFEGVATVVAKLFHIVQPDRAYFGQKDAQQLAVIRRMVRDLDMPVEIVGCPTVREPDGLAMSSRNAYLTPAQRRQALCLIEALRHAEQRVRAGQRDARAIEREMADIVRSAGPAQVDYIQVVDLDTLQPVSRIDAPALAALAVRIGATRLIDNCFLTPPG